MIKKITLLLVLLLNFVFAQNGVFAQGQYAKTIYISNVKKQVDSNWLKPIDTNGKSAVVNFTIDKQGHVSNVSLLRSSNDEAFDKSAMSAIYKVSSFPAISDKNNVTVQYFFSPIFTTATFVDTPKPMLRRSSYVDIANFYNNSQDFQAYAVDLQETLNSKWNPKSKKSEQTVVLIEVLKDGALNDVKLVKSSGDKAFDGHVLDLVANSVPFRALPSSVYVTPKEIQLTFNYIPKDKIGNVLHYVSAQASNSDGYENYAKQVDNIISTSLGDQTYYKTKALSFEICIEKLGNIKYVKITKPSKNLKFNRAVLAVLQKTSFPPIPAEMKKSSLTLRYSIFTQKKFSSLHFKREID